MKVKLKQADIWFSKCIRERSNWTCERCGKYYPTKETRGLECSHFHSRAKWGVRFDPINCEALCTGCHMYLGGNPYIHNEERLIRNGQEALDRLLIRANSQNLGRLAKRAESDIAKHYKQQFSIMQSKRIEGEIGRIEFEEFKLI